MQDIVIDFSPEGVVRGMHRDEFNLGFLGKQKIERASEIKFNADKQQWEIFIPRTVSSPDLGTAEVFCLIEECGTFDSYNVARHFEVKWMNECRLVAVAPESDEGRLIAKTLAAAYQRSQASG